MNDLMIHTNGGKCVGRDELEAIPVPEATASYQPVSHFVLANTLATIGQDLLRGYTLAKEQYGLARQGKQMFAIQTYSRDNSEMGLSIGFRNSYDKSMAIGIAIGATVFVCDNLALTGEITVLRKHTANVWSALEETVIATLYRSQHNFDRICEDAEVLKGRELENDEAFRTMGLLFGNNIITPRQLPVLKRQWLHPCHEEFKPRNMWSFYNSCTEILKSTPPLQVMEKHIKLHTILMPGGTS
jgi:hypothetical protein